MQNTVYQPHILAFSQVWKEFYHEWTECIASIYFPVCTFTDQERSTLTQMSRNHLVIKDNSLMIKCQFTNQIITITNSLYKQVNC